MSRALLSLEGIRLTYGSTPLLEDAALSVAERDRVCLVGRNGSGKSTLLRIAARLVEPDAGIRYVHPAARVVYLAQEADFGPAATALDYVESCRSPVAGEGVARRLIDELSLDPSAEPASLSGGEARRLAIAGALAAEPDVLLLDEPTNHLDVTAIEWLERRLASLRAAVVLISHDRRLLETVSRATVWLDRGTTRRLGEGFSGFEAWRDRLLEEEEVERHKLDRKIVREQQWMHGGVTARRKRNVRRVRELAELRRQRKEARIVPGAVVLTAGEATAVAGRIVIEAEGISKSFGAGPVVRDLSVRIARGDRVGVVGANGAGKTTLLKMLTGKLAPDTGQIRLGTNIELVELDQRRDELDPDVTLADALTGGRGDQVIVDGKPRHVVGYMRDFLFAAEQARTPVGVLSGGERARLMLARALARPSNLLVLDEPTNDLDLETLDLLQEMLADYSGTLLLVSHDRDFLDRTVTSVLASEGEGRWIEYAGGYSDMLAQRAAGAPDSVARSRPAGRGAAPAAEAEAAAAVKVKRKLSYKERHALEALPGEIAALQAAMARLEAEIADPRLYARDRARFDAAAAELADKRGKLEAAEEKWLELEYMRIELEE